MDLCATAGFNYKKGVLVTQGNHEKIKFRHVLFEPITAEEDGSDTASESNDVPKEHKIENWPAVHDAAKEALASMVDTHRVIPLPAYDMHGALLWPMHYRSYSKEHWYRSISTSHIGPLAPRTPTRLPTLTSQTSVTSEY
ncbi:hypothetical protein LshimejAT787_1702690 [Lyophyllum shimeji]|uniref:Uncharacterized protein n=1 Tax=Lyophyllum shimeji TaxID=47721 RepID=A0A9P3Q0J5_LYOSH|nr:hypothetical protein LshimejAT787_1702690 [Lyophyllum shimeji]